MMFFSMKSFFYAVFLNPPIPRRLVIDVRPTDAVGVLPGI